MAIITAPITGDPQVDSWAHDVSKAVNKGIGQTGGVASATGSGLGVTSPVNAVTLVLYKRYSSATLPSSEYIQVNTKYTYSTTEL